MRTSSRWFGAAALAGATLLAATVPAAPPAQATPRPTVASVTGTAEFSLPYWPDSDLRRFTFDVRAAPYTRPLAQVPSGLPTDAVGTIIIEHTFRERNVTFRSEVTVDCMVTGPRSATVTGIVTKFEGPTDKLGQADKDTQTGARVGLSVYDGNGERGERRIDRVGFNWAFGLDQNGEAGWELGKVGLCMAPAPFAPVTKGGYTVRHAELSPPPGSR